MTATSESAPPSVLATLLPIMAAVAAGFPIVGLALPVLPLRVHENLGFGTVVVGLVAGSQFAAVLFSRIGAGSCSDTYGPKRAAIMACSVWRGPSSSGA